MTENLPALVFLVPLATAICMPVAGHGRRELCRPLALVAAAAMLLLSVASLWSVVCQGSVRYSFSGWVAPLGIEWLVDPLAATMVVAVSALGVLCLLYGGTVRDQRHDGHPVPYYTIVLLLLAGLSGAVYAGDLFNIFVFLEVVSLCAYALVALPGGRALVSAFRYLLMGTLGTAFYLLGVGYFYAATGSLNIADLAQQVPDLLGSKAVLGGLMFMLVGLAIKMALMPLHGWLPEAYSDGPTAVVPLLAGLVTKVALLVWIRILFWVMPAGGGQGAPDIFSLVSSVGILASVIGACIALRQRELKRIFAYGGISHIGLVMIGIGQANQTGLTSSVYYLLNDAVMQCTLFVLAGFLVQRYAVRTLDDAGRASIRDPWVVGTFVVVALGMVGLPPTGGFFGKFGIILGAVEADNYVAAGAVVLTTLVTLGYFARILERLVRRADTEPGQQRLPTPWVLRASIATLAAAILGLGIWNDPILQAFIDATGGLAI